MYICLCVCVCVSRDAFKSPLNGKLIAPWNLYLNQCIYDGGNWKKLIGKGERRHIRKRSKGEKMVFGKPHHTIEGRPVPISTSSMDMLEIHNNNEFQL